MSTNHKISAAQVFAVMQSDYKLTPEQTRAVEQADPTVPNLVVAGAGSGKTELMAVRVLFLVANEYAKPQEILGLTFTRKAASELSKRIYKNLLKLRTSDLWPKELGDNWAQPTVSTYNSYANSLYRDYALALGYDSDSVLLSDARGFQVAREVILKQAGGLEDEIVAAGIADIDRLVEAMMQMASDLNDNICQPEDVVAWAEEVLAEIGNLPGGVRGVPNGNFEPGDDYKKSLLLFSRKPIIAKLAQLYREEKRKNGFVDFSDQVVLAELAAGMPEVRLRETTRFKQVLLDEYQDTSYLQTRLLNKLFHDHPVYAVGDPNQSIYGWRGASSSNLTNFATDFVTEPSGATKSGQFDLPQSWRNPINVLKAANHIVAPLKIRPDYLPADAGLIEPEPLTPRPGAADGIVNVVYEQTMTAEAEQIAEWFKARVKEATKLKKKSKPTDPDEYEHHSAALLLRNRGRLSVYLKALHRAEVPVEIIGVSGLLQVPEIVDLVSALRVIADPNAGTYLIRLLTGARWRIGMKDIDSLYRFASYMNTKSGRSGDSIPEDSTSIIDALDLLRDDYHASRTHITKEGLARMRDAAETFAKLRAYTGLPLLDFVRAVLQELWLDIEVNANPDNFNPMVNLDAFLQSVANYASTTQNPSILSFLSWLDFAETREKFDVPRPTPEGGVVQVLTIHSAKGLEWDYVCVANVSEGEFPSSTPVGKQPEWLETGRLPFALRGDKRELPQFNYHGIPTQAYLNNAIADYKGGSKNPNGPLKVYSELEERRLFYVAVTRPMKELMISGAWYKPGAKTKRAPSKFLYELAQLPKDVIQIQDRQMSDDVFPPCESASNPEDDNLSVEQWPLDPLGLEHARRLRAAKELVDRAIAEEDVLSEAEAEAAKQRADDKTATRRAKADENHAARMLDIQYLIDEQTARINRNWSVELGIRVSASRFKDYASDVMNLAGKMLRPVPEEPFRATRAGTIFHNLMEQSYAIEREGDEKEFEFAFVPIADLAQHEELIEKLKENFKESKWAGLEPEAVEIEIQVAQGNNIFICKIDAVFKTEEGIEIVDWKTGKPPTDEVEKAQRAMQLALYKMAWHRLKGTPLDQIKATLYYVDENLPISPELINEAEIFAIWNGVPEASRAAAAS